MTPDQRDKLDASHDEYRLTCNGEQVVVVSGPAETALLEAFHYAEQYRHDGRVIVNRVDGDDIELVAIMSQIKNPTMCGDKWLNTGNPFPCECCNGTKVIPSVGDCPECVK